MELVKLIKKRMIDRNRMDFGNYLAEILSISPQAAGKKLNGKTKITAEDLTKITAELDLDPVQLKGALIK